MTEKELPVSILSRPHWRVNIRPRTYQDNAIESLSRCMNIVVANQVRLRGWYYPHISSNNDLRGQGNTWVASWVETLGYSEYWRFYQSRQFLHLFAVREAAEPRWREKLQADLRSHLRHLHDVDWDAIPGFISVLSFIFTTTEIVEFATRLSAAGVYDDGLFMSISLIGIRGFALTVDWNRAWNNFYAATEDVVENVWELDPQQLVGQSTAVTLEAATWFFERFGWFNPSQDMMRNDIENYKAGRG